MNTILIIDDDTAICRTLELHYSLEGHKVLTAHNAESGLRLAVEVEPDIVILDIQMSGQSGLQALPQLKELLPNSRVIMITAFHDMENTIEAMKNGADDYIAKPIDLDELDIAVFNALYYHQENGDDIEINSDPGNPTKKHVMVGHSRALKEVFKVIGRVANSSATVLVTGESGTGKELVSRAIHNSGPNAKGPFIAVNCAALVDTLLESEMFGHEKGAFTGAINRQLGKFSLADNGTLFLDEISELSLSMQAKLLRALQEKEITPIGAKCTMSTNARVISATNKNLETGVEEGTFREDLFYRLQVVNIHIPPLRERTEDIPGLVEAILMRLGRESGRIVNRIALDVMQALCNYKWPGNVRELENTLTKAVALCSSNTITLDFLPPNFHQVEIENNDYMAQPIMGLTLEGAEREHIIQVLNVTSWHKGKACEVLGISRPRLRRMIEKYNLTQHKQSN